MEYGIASVMRQYQANIKARALLGPIAEDSPETRPRQSMWCFMFGGATAHLETDNENSTTTASALHAKRPPMARYHSDSELVPKP